MKDVHQYNRKVRKSSASISLQVYTRSNHMMWYKVKYGILISLQYTGHGQSGSIVIEDDGLSDSG